MALGKQAKVLSKQQIETVHAYLGTTRHPYRNRLIFGLSTKAGLRAKEIACLTWAMVLTAEGKLADELMLTDGASKGRSGRSIPINRELKQLLAAWREQRLNASPQDRIISTERSQTTTPQVLINLFRRWYSAMGFVGCSSHSGRRTFITQAARKISGVGGSLRDVQALAGHSSLATTQRYIEVSEDAKRRVVEQLL